MKKIFIILFIILAFGANTTNARHLVGGNIGYEYLRTLPNGNLEYRIYLFIYRDCSDPNGAAFDDPLFLGIYNNNLTKSLYDSISIYNPVIRDSIKPQSTSKCAFSPNVCLEEGYYETIVSLAPSSTGYHLSYQRCCRNNAVNNLVTGSGQDYYGFIPNTALQNSSPTFADIPVPYMCVGDLNYMSNLAIDKDGDSLVYRFDYPYTAGTQNRPLVRPPAFMNSQNVASYNPGYSLQLPFGAGGQAIINAQNGLSTYKSNQLGNYVIVVTVDEIRNGVVIASTRRDIQILVVQCPPNPAPALDTIRMGGTYLNVLEGDTIVFPIFISDSDSIKVTLGGNLLNPNAAIMAPRPIVTYDTSGIDSVQSVFTWNTACGHKRNTPYSFTITAKDDGCPSKTIIYEVFIKVVASTLSDSIFGKRRFCPNDTATYSTNGPSTSTYYWFVQNGNIVSPLTGNSVLVRWSSTPGQGGKVKVVEVSKNGCVGDTLYLNTEVLREPIANAGTAVTICSYDTIRLGGLPNPDYKYTWSPNTHLSASNVANPSFGFVNLSNQDTTLCYALEVDYNFINCINYIVYDTTCVTIHPFNSKATNIKGEQEVCEFTQGVVYHATKFDKSRYTWVVKGGTLKGFANRDSVIIDWGRAGIGSITVLEIDSNGCAGSRNTIFIDIVGKPQTGVIYGDSIVCTSNLRGQKYEVRSRPSSSVFNWAVSGGAIVSGNGTSSIVVDWAGVDSALVEVYETNATGCIGDVVKKLIDLDNPQLQLVSVSTLEQDDNYFEVKWQGQDLSLFKKSFTIWYRLQGTTRWNTLGTTDFNTFNYTTNALPTNSAVYEFKVSGINHCESEFESDVDKNLLLTVLKTDDNNAILASWNSYYLWDNGVKSYQLYQGINESELSVIQTSSRDTDYVQKVGYDDYLHCYRVLASERFGNEAISYSNKVCVGFDPVLYIPSAFSPQASPQINDNFVLAGGRYKAFNMDVYNRWGEKMYSTTDIRTSWDGKVNGEVVPSGLYIYVITYTAYNNESRTLRGTISVIR